LYSSIKVIAVPTDPVPDGSPPGTRCGFIHYNNWPIHLCQWM